jgi:programmed cell death protein 5
MEDELAEIRRQRLDELQNLQMQRQIQEQQKFQQQVDQLEMLVKQRLTNEALQRYSNIRAANPELAIKVLAVVSNLMQNQNIAMINDEQLKMILQKIAPAKKEFKIKRV